MISEGKCEHCRQALAKGALHDALEEIGKDVLIRQKIGKGHDQTVHRFAQCKACGSLWVTLIDSGAGGHGRFHRCLTNDLF